MQKSANRQSKILLINEQRNLDYGPSLMIQWVPVHAMIEGNETADTAAKDVTQKEGIETDGWGSFTHTKTELQLF